MRRLNVKQANTRRERIARNVEKLYAKRTETPNVTPMTSFHMDKDVVFPRKG
jgi:hypothetical protein